MVGAEQTKQIFENALRERDAQLLDSQKMVTALERQSEIDSRIISGQTATVTTLGIRCENYRIAEAKDSTDLQEKRVEIIQLTAKVKRLEGNENGYVQIIKEHQKNVQAMFTDNPSNRPTIFWSIILGAVLSGIAFYSAGLILG